MRTRQANGRAVLDGEQSDLLRGLLAFSFPVRPHLSETIHVDGRSLAFFFTVHRLEEIECAGEVLLNGLGSRAVVQAFDLRQLVVRAQHRELHRSTRTAGRWSRSVNRAAWR